MPKSTRNIRNIFLFTRLQVYSSANISTSLLDAQMETAMEPLTVTHQFYVLFEKYRKLFFNLVSFSINNIAFAVFSS